MLTVFLMAALGGADFFMLGPQARSLPLAARRSGLAFIFVVVHSYAFQIFGFENLSAIQTAYIINPIPPVNWFRPTVNTPGSHRSNMAYSTQPKPCVKRDVF